MSCPVCDHTDLSVQALLGRLDDLNTIIALALDFAEHVVGQTINPDEAKGWLTSARTWREDPDEARKVAGAARAWSPGKSVQQGAWAAGKAILWATAAASMAGTQGASVRALEKTAKYAVRAAVNEAYKEARTRGEGVHAADAAADEATEGKWQLSHARELACVCNPPVPPEFFEPRSRTSSLAD